MHLPAYPADGGIPAGVAPWCLALVGLFNVIGSYGAGVLCGDLYDTRGSYDVTWWLSIALGLIAALLHWPIDERAVVRLPVQT